MGQYRQWLQYREENQQLHAQRERLEQKLQQLQERISLFEASLPDIDNTIIQALALQTRTEEQLPSAVISQQIPSPNGSTASEPEPETVSRTFLNRSSLPNLDSFAELQEPPPPGIQPSVYAPLPPLPRQDADLLPQDMSAFIDEHSRTEPQLPDWVRQAALAAAQQGPLDQQSIRTNRLVQRWLERWGRPPAHPESNNAVSPDDRQATRG